MPDTRKRKPEAPGPPPRGRDRLAILQAWLDKERRAAIPFTEEWCRRRGIKF